jgi:hypothetical protein
VRAVVVLFAWLAVFACATESPAPAVAPTTTAVAPPVTRRYGRVVRVGSDEVWTKMRHYRDQMCECASQKSATCAKAVSDDMSHWASTFSNRSNVDPPPPTDSQMEIIHSFTECAMKAMVAGMPNQP